MEQGNKNPRKLRSRLSQKPTGKGIQTTRQRIRKTTLFGMCAVIIGQAAMFFLGDPNQELEEVVISMESIPNPSDCNGPQVLRYSILNFSPENYTDQVITLKLSDGTQYLAGSLSSSSGHQLGTATVFSPDSLAFTVSELAPDDLLVFEISYDRITEQEEFILLAATLHHQLFYQSAQGISHFQEEISNPLAAPESLLEVFSRTESFNCGQSTHFSLIIRNIHYTRARALRLQAQLPANGSATWVDRGTKLSMPENGFSREGLSSTQMGDLWELSFEDLGLDSLFTFSQNPSGNQQIELSLELALGDDFDPSEPIAFTLLPISRCGEEMPRVPVIHHLSMGFEENTQAGITELKGETWSVTWADYDNDSYEDIFITEKDMFTPNYLYRNKGDGTFVAVTGQSLVNDKSTSTGATWADYDNDGDIDVFISNHIRSNQLYRNQGDGTFYKMKGETDAYQSYSHNSLFMDYNNDGHLDIFLTDIYPTKTNVLYRNRGEGTFQTMQNHLLSLEQGSSIGATSADYDNDGRVDLFVPNINDEANYLYHNEGDGNFRKIETGPIATDIAYSTGGTWGDYDNDGDLDLYVTNGRNQQNFFYENNGDGTFAKIENSIVTQADGHTHGASWMDLDNDGDLDLFVTNNEGNIHELYLNNGNKSFTHLENAYFPNKRFAMSHAWADYDKDGDLDLFVAHLENSQNAFYENTYSGCNNWIGFQLKGVKSNRSAIGAKIRVLATIQGKATWQMREISSQTAGTSAQSSLIAYFGLGNATQVDSVSIEWPSGLLQSIEKPKINDQHEVLEDVLATICGKIYYDENRNRDMDEEDRGIARAVVQVMPGDIQVLADGEGHFSTKLAPGEYTIHQVRQAGASVAFDTVYSINLNTREERCGLNFPNAPEKNDVDAALEISIGGPRADTGEESEYVVSYENNGEETEENLVLTVEFDHDILPNKSSEPWSYIIRGEEKDTYVWELTDVPPSSKHTIHIQGRTNLGARIGKKILLRSRLKYKTDAPGTFSAEDTDEETIEAPIQAKNQDMNVFPRGIVEAGDTLHYKINFQNHEAYTVSRIIIRDTLPSYIDIKSIRIEATSHPHVFTQIQGRVITWFIEQAGLRDKRSDMAKSKGFIRFKAALTKEIPAGTDILNRMVIRMEHGPIQRTNWVKNTVGKREQIVKENPAKLVLYPNPAIEVAKAKVIMQIENDTQIEIKKLELYDIRGNKVWQRFCEVLTDIEIPANNFPMGVYVVKAFDRFGQSYSDKLVIKR